MIDISKFKIHTLNPKKPTPENTVFYNKVFDLWMNTWDRAYKIYWNSKDVFSDQFTRQTYQLVLTYEDTIVGLMAYDKKNINLRSTRRDSYFRMWDELSFKKIQNASPKGDVLVCSWFTLGKEWRKLKHGIDAKKLLLAIAIKEFELSGEDVMSGTIVHTGKLHEECYKHSATPILRDTTEKDLPVDLLMWEKNKVCSMQYPYYTNILQQLFKEEEHAYIAQAA